MRAPADPGPASPGPARPLNYVATVIRRHLKAIGSRWRTLSPPAGKAGIALTELSNGPPSADDPVLLQKICDALHPGTVNVSSRRWLSGEEAHCCFS